jgi:hypothetical protein
MMVVPVGNTKFAGTPERLTLTEPSPLQLPLSVAVAVPSSSSRVAVHEPVVTLTSGGTSSTGGVVSPLLTATVTVCVQEATLPFVLSVAIHVIMVEPPGNGSESDKPSFRVATTSTLLSDGFVVGIPIVDAEMVASQLPSGAVTLTFPGQEIVTGALSSAATTVII